MTSDSRRRVLEAIAECDRYIAKESPRSADLRPIEIAARLDFSRSHRQKLLNVLHAADQRFITNAEIIRMMQEGK